MEDSHWSLIRESAGGVEEEKNAQTKQYALMQERPGVLVDDVKDAKQCRKTLCRDDF